ncbi:MAG: hypothetical protein B7Z55_16250 [Planctomycetales bacterium 12-60-4]|nr:MAG: hypothetical protein B7Z55_16250 [Planctomycetales bacterium 12-60-4]
MHRRPEIPFLATLGCGLVILGSLRQCTIGCDPWQCLMIGSSPAPETLIALGTPIGAVVLVATHLLNAHWRRQRPVRSPFA